MTAVKRFLFDRQVSVEWNIGVLMQAYLTMQAVSSAVWMNIIRWMYCRGVWRCWQMKCAIRRVIPCQITQQPWQDELWNLDQIWWSGMEGSWCFLASMRGNVCDQWFVDVQRESCMKCRNRADTFSKWNLYICWWVFYRFQLSYCFNKVCFEFS